MSACRLALVIWLTILCSCFLEGPCVQSYIVSVDSVVHIKWACGQGSIIPAVDFCSVSGCSGRLIKPPVHMGWYMTGLATSQCKFQWLVFEAVSVSFDMSVEWTRLFTDMWCTSAQVQFGSVEKKINKKHEEETAPSVDVLEFLHPTSGWLYPWLTSTYVLVSSLLGIVW